MYIDGTFLYSQLLVTFVLGKVA